MLEKIGLPAKPSLRGSNWVVDASHCQGCSSQFSFINRKHHCRRCGGLFCNSCTQNRMILRGQGDSPVRICEPCKKLEEAARFEMRHGHKSRAGRGSSKLTAKYEDDALIQILGTDGKDSFFSARESTTDTASEFQGSMSSASCSSLHVEAQHGEGYIPRSPSIDALNQNLSESVSVSPEKLRHQALEEKKKYRILKAEGKPEEALKAFKKGKELEREAEAVEVALRKSRRKALSSSSVENMHQIEDDRKEACRKRKPSSQMGKEEKDDLAAELRELGWADTDLHKDDTKPASLSLEGELSSLLGEVPRKSNPGAGTGGSDRSQVLALKKKALMLKREGKLAEAKEELKRAKILEKQLEEQEFLAEAEDSDDELSALIRSMDDDKQDDFYQQETDFEFDHPVGFSDDLGVDGNFEVTDEDMDDPEISAALKSLGWTEDADHLEKSVPPVPKDREAILDEILSLKREAVYQKRAGNAVEAMAQLKKAKLLERDLESLQSQENSLNALNPTMQKDLVSQTGEKSSKLINMDNVDCGVVPRSKIVIQKELLSLKKKALALRREGRLDEAEEELNKGKVLERQLEEMENSSKVKPRKMTDGNRESKQPYKHSDVSGTPPLGDEVVDGDVTDQDMNDPAMLSLLKNLGWEDEDIEPAPSKPFKQMGNRSVLIDSATQGFSSSPFVEPRKSKSEIQRELLVLKRKALALRRQGESEEAEEVLRMTKVLEGQMAEIEAQKKGVLVDSKDEFDGLGSLLPQQKEENSYSVHETEIINPPISSSMEKRAEGGEVTENVMHDPPALLVLGSTSIGMTTEPSKEMSSQSLLASDALGNQTASGTSAVASGKNKAGIQRELLGLKRKALALRRQGETEEAEEVLKMAKVLEAEMEEMEVPKKEFLSDSTVHRELDSFQSLVSHDKHGNMKYVDESNRGTQLAVELKEEVAEKSMVPDWKGSNVAKSFPWSSADLIPGISHLIEDKNSLNARLDPPPDKKTGEATSSLPLSGQSVPVTDLLTGDDWKSSQLPVHELEDKGNIGLNIPSIADSIQRGTSETLDREWGSRNELRSDKSEKTALAIQKSTHEVNSYPVSESHKQQSSLKQEILDRKRKAVSLKREGKLGEAREELRQAKILEKRPDENPQPSTVLIDACASKPNVTYVGQKVQKATDQASRPMPGRDRFKLQQESLAHKRQALKLRREGRMEEAEAEFQLAKDLETQLEEAGHDLLSSNKNISEAEAMNDVGVEDLLDPQLMSALKAIGLQHADTVSHPPQRTEASRANISNSDKSNQEISQLEDRIKAEKVKAINLKRAGKQSEALDALRHAKQLEKKLNSLTSK